MWGRNDTAKTMTAINYRAFKTVGRGEFRARRRGWISKDSMCHKVLFAWFHMGQSTRKLIVSKPSEADLLKLLLISDLAFFLSWTMKAVIVPHSAGVSLISVKIGALFLGSLVIRTAAFYLLAMVMGAICRIFGGRGTWQNTRIAVFWGTFVAAPFAVLAAILSVSFAQLSVYYPIFGADWIAKPPYWLGLLPTVWFIAAGVSKAHGFRQTSPIFMSLSVVALVGLIATMYFRARGMI